MLLRGAGILTVASYTDRHEILTAHRSDRDELNSKKVMGGKSMNFSTIKARDFIPAALRVRGIQGFRIFSRQGARGFSGFASQTIIPFCILNVRTPKVHFQQFAENINRADTQVCPYIRRIHLTAATWNHQVWRKIIALTFGKRLLL